jgi:hypothetical protein
MAYLPPQGCSVNNVPGLDSAEAGSNWDQTRHLPWGTSASNPHLLWENFGLIGGIRRVTLGECCFWGLRQRVGSLTRQPDKFRVKNNYRVATKMSRVPSRSLAK